MVARPTRCARFSGADTNWPGRPSLPVLVGRRDRTGDHQRDRLADDPELRPVLVGRVGPRGHGPGHPSFLVSGGPSWKPLPFLFTTVYGIFGSAAPRMWVVTARVGGIAGLIGALRLLELLCKRMDLPRYAGVVGGGSRPPASSSQSGESVGLLLLPRRLRGAVDRRLALGDRAPAGKALLAGVLPGCLRGTDAARGVAVPARLRSMAVVEVPEVRASGS